MTCKYYCISQHDSIHTMIAGCSLCSRSLTLTQLGLSLGQHEKDRCITYVNALVYIISGTSLRTGLWTSWDKDFDRSQTSYDKITICSNCTYVAKV